MAGKIDIGTRQPGQRGCVIRCPEQRLWPRTVMAGEAVREGVCERLAGKRILLKRSLAYVTVDPQSQKESAGA